jgi:hypothetical protein
MLLPVLSTVKIKNREISIQSDMIGQIIKKNKQKSLPNKEYYACFQQAAVYIKKIVSGY